MNDPYMVELGNLIRRIDPEIELEKIEFNLSKSQDEIIHFGCYHEVVNGKIVKISWKELSASPFCHHINQVSLTNLITNCVDKTLATAVEILLDLDRFDHRTSEEIRADIKGLDDVVETAFELTRFENEIWEMFAPAISAIPTRYQSTLQPVAQSIGDKIDRLIQETIANTQVREHLIKFYEDRKKLDHTVVFVALEVLWFFQPTTKDNKEADVLYAAVRSFIPEIRNKRALVKIPRWLYTQIDKQVPNLVISRAYDTLDEKTIATAVTLWSDSDDEIYHEFDQCVKAAQLINS
jgi:hypothetical protein